jgi:hypothetical protein
MLWSFTTVFDSSDTASNEGALPGLDGDIGASWRGVLTEWYPELAIQVEVADGTDSGEYGSSVTLWTQPRERQSPFVGGAASVRRASGRGVDAVAPTASRDHCVMGVYHVQFTSTM